MKFASLLSLPPNHAKLFTAIGGFLLFLGTSLNANATNYFNWGVETLKVDYGVNGPGTYDLQPLGNTSRDCTVAHTGKCSSKLVVYGPDGGNQGLGWDTIQQNPPYPWRIAGGPALYYRWWMRIMPGFSWGTGTALSKSHRVGASDNSFSGWTAFIAAWGFQLECSTDGVCYTNTGTQTNFGVSMYYDFTKKADGVWHEYIVKLKPNTSANCTPGVNCDAQFQAWVDGVLATQYNNFKLTNNSTGNWTDLWGGWMVRPYFQLRGTASDGGTIYLDDFSTDDSYNSLIGGAPSQVYPPPNPTVK